MRRAKKVDANQPDIVEELRDIPGVEVALDHDDIIVGYRGKNFWYEVKNPDKVKKSGGFRSGALKKSQIKLRENWTGHYKVVWQLEQILEDIGITSNQ